MPAYMQNAPQQWPRNGTAPVKNDYPESVPIYAPAELPPSMTNAGSTVPSGGYQARPIFIDPTPSFGEHDALAGAIMKVSQADFYNSAVGAWPRAGVWDVPGAGVAAGGIPRLAPSTSAHPGLNMSTGAGPTMVFVAPPVFSVQSRPIYAVGL